MPENISGYRRLRTGLAEQEGENWAFLCENQQGVSDLEPYTSGFNALGVPTHRDDVGTG